MNIKSALFSGIFILFLPVCSYADWGFLISEDEMTGEISAYTFTDYMAPTKRMGWPYGEVEAALVVGCDDDFEWTYIAFTRRPNLSNTKNSTPSTWPWEFGHDLITTRIKWDEEVEYVTFKQKWGEKHISFKNPDENIKNIEKSNKALLELNWHGEGKIYFKFSLKGSSAGLKNIRNECAK